MAPLGHACGGSDSALAVGINHEPSYQGGVGTSPRESCAIALWSLISRGPPSSDAIEPSVVCGVVLQLGAPKTINASKADLFATAANTCAELARDVIEVRLMGDPCESPSTGADQGVVEHRGSSVVLLMASKR